MYIYSVTLTKEKIAILLTVILILLFGLGLLVSAIPTDGFRDTNARRRQWLENRGYHTENEPYLEETLVLPEEFDAFYSDYETIQQTQGFSLLPYRGKTVKKYTYRVSEASDNPLYINLWVFKHKIIGADVHNPDLQNGFVKPLQ